VRAQGNMKEGVLESVFWLHVNRKAIFVLCFEVNEVAQTEKTNLL